MTKKIINVARDFAPTPGARYRSDGAYSGEQFREELLIPVLRSSSGPVVIELDGTRGYATSFLEEAFGGLARKMQPTECLDRLEFVSDDDPLLVDEIMGYIREARA